MTQIKTIGLAGIGAIGGAVAKALTQNGGIPGYTLTHISDPKPHTDYDRPYVSFDELCSQCDLIIECLPPHIVPVLTESVFKHQKNLVMISSCALLMYPEIAKKQKQSTSRIFVPSGALFGLDGVKAMRELGIKESRIASTKHPSGFSTAPYVDKMGIDLHAIDTKTRIFTGNALDAAKGFPANVNVAATLSIAGIGAEQTRVEIWADPDAKGNSHEITVTGEYSEMTAKVTNMPDPNNPKSSILAAQSIVAMLRGDQKAITVL